MYQVKWFSKKKGYGFVENSERQQFFVHHSDLQVDDGFRYLKEGEYITGTEEVMEDGKVKLANIHAPMRSGKLMCEVERNRRRNTSTQFEVQMDEDEPMDGHNTD